MEEGANKETLTPNGGYPMHTYLDVEAVFSLYLQDPKNKQLIKDAYELAALKHKDQYRKSGEPYIQHPIEVAYILASLQAGPATIAAGFLHDVVEDTDTTIEDIKRQFGEEVAFLVDCLTKIQRMKLSRRTEADFEAEDHKKIFLGMAKDVRVIIIKLADRLHNMRTLSSLKRDRQIALARETLDVFAPIAHRLGMYQIQSELEELSLKYLETEKYEYISKMLDESIENRKESLDALKKRIADILFQRKIPFRIESRVKSIYSIYRKMYTKDKKFDEIYDILAVRIITKTELNCYEILGIIHATYKPVPGRFKDYIAMPKPNMYQSLHTTILAGDGNVYEIQIRTEEMDKISETGVAAHWKYKEGNYNAKEEQRDIEEKLHWFRDLVSTGESNNDAKSYMNALANDVFNANVYVFTPMGKVIDLPQGGTVLDFAYKIHTKVGDSATGGIVNGNFVPLNHPLKTGDVCEVKTSKTSPGPSSAWLNYVATSAAKNHIKRFLNAKLDKENAAELARKGKETMLEAAKACGIEEADLEEALTKKALDEYHFDKLEDLYKAINSKNPTASAVLSFLGYRRKPTLPSKTFKVMASKDDKNPVYVHGIDNLAVTLGRCCSPVPGDTIVGYITKGKGLTVHRPDCKNIVGQENRCVEVFWKDNLEGRTFPAQIQIQASDRPSLIADILAIVSTKNVPVKDLRAKLINNTNTVDISVTVFVKNEAAIQEIFGALTTISGVYKTSRTNH